MSEWKYHVPARDGHAPDDWVGIAGWEWKHPDFCGWQKASSGFPSWSAGYQYRYRPLQDATVEPSFDTLKDQCLRLPQDQREALIEAMQKPVRDWADDVAIGWFDDQEARGVESLAAVIRSMCRPKAVQVDAEELFFDIIEESGYDTRVRECDLDDKDKAAIRLIREALS